MRLGHVLNESSHDQLADTVHCLGAPLGSGYVDDGIYPRFSTSNFTLPLQNGHYTEVFCPLVHPSSDSTPFGKTVSQRAAEGGGWLKWVVTVNDVSKIENYLGCAAVDGQRTNPDGKDLAWKQIGVLGTIEDKQLPFFIEWFSFDHPSTYGTAIAKIVKVEIAGDELNIEEWFGSELRAAIGSDVEVEWISADANDSDSRIIAIHVMTPSSVVRLDEQ